MVIRDELAHAYRDIWVKVPPDVKVILSFGDNQNLAIVHQGDVNGINSHGVIQRAPLTLHIRLSDRWGN